MHLEASFRAGMFPISTMEAPGAQGAMTTGTQGTGVRTPLAATVAAATAGFDGVRHIPKAGMFVMGTKSMIFAAAGPPVSPMCPGITFNAAGAAPKEHFSCAPEQTCFAMFDSPWPEPRQPRLAPPSNYMRKVIFGQGTRKSPKETGDLYRALARPESEPL